MYSSFGTFRNAMNMPLYRRQFSAVMRPTSRAGAPATIVSGRTSFVTTELAPTIERASDFDAAEDFAPGRE